MGSAFIRIHKYLRTRYKRRNKYNRPRKETHRCSACYWVTATPSRSWSSVDNDHRGRDRFARGTWFLHNLNTLHDWARSTTIVRALLGKKGKFERSAVAGRKQSSPSREEHFADVRTSAGFLYTVADELHNCCMAAASWYMTRRYLCPLASSFGRRFAAIWNGVTLTGET